MDRICINGLFLQCLHTYSLLITTSRCHVGIALSTVFHILLKTESWTLTCTSHFFQQQTIPVVERGTLKVTELNSFMCSGLNWTGLLCSQCQQGLGPAVLTYRRQCVKCLDKRYGWLLYITATLVPTTILCFLVMIFQFHVTSAEMNYFMFYCQFITCVNTFTNYSYVYIQPVTDFTLIRFLGLAVLTFCGIWNLDTSFLHFALAVTWQHFTH